MDEDQGTRKGCHYFVTRKRRYCRMTVKEGQNFCGEHIDHSEIQLENAEVLRRIPCPNDPKHSCYEQHLQKHLKKCNARQKENPDYIIPGINNDPAQTENKRTKSLAETEGEDLLQLIEKIKYISEDVIPVVDKEIYCHSVLADELKNPEYGPSTLKHRLQNASLIGHIEHSNLVQPDTCFIEFGAGRGQLSFWLGQVACQNQHNLLLLIDKESHRHKFDKQLLLTSKVQVQRLRANIADLSLAHVPTIQEYSHWVGISKHLCGAATDLALRCFTTTCNLVTSMGLIMAPCCHHKGDWSNYIGKEFLLAYGITAEEFWPMTGIASWATCGISNCTSRTAESDCKQSNRHVTLNLHPEEKEDIGKKCKKILDYGRLKYLEGLGFRSKLVYYISEEISPENLCMVAVKD